MKEAYSIEQEEEVRAIILKEATFPTNFHALQERVLEQGVDVNLLALTCIRLVNDREMKEFPGYSFQAAGDHPHQLFLMDPSELNWTPQSQEYNPSYIK